MPPPLTWEAFCARLKEIYWPSLAPAARETERVLPDGSVDSLVPPDLWQAMIVVFPDPVAWLDNPIPQLGGRTPYQALEKGRADEVRGLVMGVADFFLPEPSEVVPWQDYEDALATAEPSDA